MCLFVAIEGQKAAKMAAIHGLDCTVLFFLTLRKCI